ncbi:hypothetical protein BMT54_06435 [Pasteurellaceae bacterium 15-036681]|nr:hypothetical protein BMT54_06435 [Pasteurellaceae bacterium 15-036681]
MFNGLSKILIVVILGLCAWLWGQYQIMSSLKAENLTQAQTIAQQQAANKELAYQLEVEKQAVEIQQKIANELRKQTETKREQIKTILVKEPCAHTTMPGDVRSGIEQLHERGRNKD